MSHTYVEPFLCYCIDDFLTIDCIIEKYGADKFNLHYKTIKGKCMQKCTDKANKGKAGPQK